MDIEILRLIEGAGQAEGLTVIIDVFRAFSMECYLYALGAKEVRPVGSIEETFAWKDRDSSCILVGERHGRKIDGCDLGNSPSSINPEMIRGKRIIHTTSAGTQGIVNAKSSPDRSGTDLFTLHEGTKVTIRETIGEWVNVRVGRNEGWIRLSCLERI